MARNASHGPGGFALASRWALPVAVALLFAPAAGSLVAAVFVGASGAGAGALAWLPLWLAAAVSAALVAVPWCAIVAWQLRKLAQVVHAVRHATVIVRRDDLGAGLAPELGEAVELIRELQRSGMSMARRHIRARSAVQALFHGGEAVILFAPDGSILLMNLAAELLFGVSRDSATLELLRARLCPVGARLLADEFGRLGSAAASPHPKSKEALCELRRRGGQVARLDLSVCQVDLDGRPVLSVHALERRDAAPLQPNDADVQAKARYVSMLGHELRTPLNTLIAAVDQLSGDGASAPARLELIAAARESTRAMRSLVDDLLDLAKIDAGKLDLEAVPFDICQQVSQCVKSFGALAAARGIRLHMTESLEEGRLIGDPRRVTQLVSNLLANAIKFTDKGSVEVRLSSGICKDDDTCCDVVIEVEDTGIGMNEAEQARIFEPFTQANASINRRYGGTGLGLALCREWAAAMHGSIAVVSAPGAGSTFTVRLRLARAFGTPVFRDSEPPTDEVRGLAGKASVLLADDNVLSRHLFTRWLGSECTSVDCVGNGEEAVAAVSARDYDVVLMDVSMPKLNGIDATKIIRALPRVTAAGVPRRSPQIIGITAFDMAEDRAECLAAGMNDYITKPIDRTELLEKIAQAQRRARAQRLASEDLVAWQG